MDLFLKACGGVLLSVILVLMLGSRSRELALVLTMLVCVMTALMALEYIRPVLEFVSQLEKLGGLDGDMVKILLKATGIGMLTELASLVCGDSGSSSLGRMIKLLGNAVILWLSLPMFTILLQLLQEIMGGL
jgi:stage III sporulation protein AD